MGDGGAGDERGHGPRRQADGEVPAIRVRRRPGPGLIGGGALQAGREARIDVRSDRHGIVLDPHAEQGDSERPAALGHAGGGSGGGRLDDDGEGVVRLRVGGARADSPSVNNFFQFNFFFNR